MLEDSITANFYGDVDFDAPLVLGNIDRLPMNIFVDNVAYAPCAYLVADDVVVGTGEWPSRHNPAKTLSVAGAGAAPTYGQTSALENTSIKYNGAKYHKAGDTTWGQITTGDGAIEIILTLSASSEIIAASRASTGGVGWQLYTASSQIRLVIGDGTNGIDVGNGSAIATDAYCHVIFFIDYGNLCYVYTNGVYSEVSTTLASITGTEASATGFVLGARADGVVPTSRSVVQFAAWDLPSNPFPGVLKNRTYFDRIARERFAIVSGIEDQRKGNHSFTRATSAYSDKYISSTERRLFKLSSGWPRICQRKDANGLSVQGYLPEPLAINLAVQSEAMGTTWTAENLTSIGSDAIAAPDGNTTADGLKGTVTDTQHGVYQALTLPATMHCFSVFAKKGNKNWIQLYSDTTNVTCYFDLVNGVVGTAGAGITASGITSFGNDWYRCHILFTGAASAKSFYLRSANADTDNDFAGDTTTINTYFWGAQIEAATEHFPTSYIPTVAAAATRNKDELSYNVRLPIVGNINDLSQTLTIGGTDYAPCAYLVADDCQADGTWTSRHAAKSLAFAGAGTNPTPQYDSVSRSNTSVKYWASNTHAAADTTWAQPGTNDAALEATFRLDTTASQTILTTYASNTGIILATNASSQITCQMRDGTGALVTLTHTTALAAGQLTHVFVGMDRSEKAYMAVNGVIAAGTPSADITGIALTWTSAALIVGTASPRVIHAAMWSLAGTPWPGAATNQAVIIALARARYNQLCRYQSCRLDCEILHPNVDRQNNVVNVNFGNAADNFYLGIYNPAPTANEFGASVGVSNSVSQWILSGDSDVSNNVKVKQSTTIRADRATYVQNNAVIITDTSCEVPPAGSRIYIGSLYSGLYQPACLVSKVKLFRNDK